MTVNWLSKIWVYGFTVWMINTIFDDHLLLLAELVKGPELMESVSRNAATRVLRLVHKVWTELVL